MINTIKAITNSTFFITGSVFFILTSSQSIAGESTIYKSKNNFSFFKVAENDDLISSMEKFKTANFACAKGKSESMDTDFLRKHIRLDDIPKKIKKVLSADRKFDEWARGTKIESMPIDTLHCEARGDTAFNYWIFYFSVTTKKLLSVTISCHDYISIKKRLISKYGKCVEKNYCENKDNSLLIVKRDNEHFINMFFIKNIKSHYTENKKQFLKKKKKSEGLIKDAF